jgi:UDP-glucose 4-epimerase
MRALITGGAGFIGSHLTDALLREGHSVVALDDLSTGRLDNIRHLASADRFEFVRGSVLDEGLVARTVESIDVIFHLAAAVGVKLVVDHPLHTLHTNVAGTEVVLRHAHRVGALTVVASTSEVYGKATTFPFREDADLTLGPSTKCRWGYATSKLLDEFLALAYHQEHGSPVVIVRLFNTVGPRQSSQCGMVLPTFVQQALANEPIAIHGDGTQRRCFTWVGDVVWALMALAQEPGAFGQIFNLGNPEEITIAALARKVRAAAGSQSRLVHVPYAEAFGAGFEDMHRRVPDISKLRQLTGFEPRVHLDEIVALTLAYWAASGQAACVWSSGAPV